MCTGTGKSEMKYVKRTITGVVILLIQQFACSWLAPQSLLCEVVGLCVSPWLCPEPIPGLHRLADSYATLARVYWISSSAAATSVSCLKKEFGTLSGGIVTEPLQRVHELDARGLLVARRTRRLMGSIESNITVPLAAMAVVLQHNLSDIPRNAVLAACARMIETVQQHTLEVGDLVLALDGFASEIETVGIQMRIDWVPTFKEYTPQRIPASAKVGSALMLGITLLTAPISGPVSWGIGVLVGSTATWFVATVEEDWASHAVAVHSLGNKFEVYSHMVDRASTAVRAAAVDMEVIETGLVVLHDSLLRVSTDHVNRAKLGALLGAQVGAVSRAIAAERMHLLSERATAVDACDKW
jgi:hypothetical protein